MKKYPLFVLIACLLFFTINAQTYQQSYQLLGQALTANKGILLSDGNLLQVGCIAPTVSYHDVLVAKIKSTDGDTVWCRSFHIGNMILSGMDVAEINKNNLMIAVNGADSGTGNNYHHVLYLQLDSTGALLQSNTYNNMGSYSGMYATGMRLLPNDQLLTMAVSYDTLGMLIQKISPTGALQFSKSILLTGTAGVSEGYLFDVIRKGDAYYFVGNANYDGNSPDLLMIKTDTMGNVQWVKSSFSGTWATLYVVSAHFVATNDNNITLALGTGVSTSLVKMDTSGVISSFILYENSSTTSSIYQPYLKSVFQLPGGDILLGGITDLQNNVNTGTHVGRPFLLKTDSSGAIKWCRKYTEASNLNSVTFIGQTVGQDFGIGGSAYDFVNLSPTNTHPRLYMMRLDSAGHVGASICGNDTLYAVSATNLSKVLNNEGYVEKNAPNLISLPVTETVLHPNISSLGMNTGVGIIIQPSVICQGSNALISVNSTVNPGTNPVYKFYVNNVLVQTGNASTYNTNSLNNTDQITCEIISNAPCVSPVNAISPALTAAIYPTTNPSITISASPSTTVNTGVPILFTATVTNAGLTPYYSWTRNGIHVGGNSPTYYDAVPINGDVIACSVSSSTCAPISTMGSNTLLLTVNGSSGISNITPATINIALFPNPVENDLHLLFDQELEGQLIIRNVLGSICYGQTVKGKSCIVPLSFAAGFYELEIISKNGVGRTSFLKK